MKKDIKVYLVAGEPSGDLLGSRLMRAIKSKTDNKVNFCGVGGDTMKEEGLNSLFNITDLAVMGLAEVIPSIPKVLNRINETVENIKEEKPDVIITIDSWGFTGRVNKALKKEKLNIQQIHYVAPQVWAWKKKRAKTMHKYVDCLLTLLPNEPKYFKPYGLETHFVGHPVIEGEASKGSKDQLCEKYNVPKNKTLITLLPGSRHNEVQKLLPIYVKLAEELYGENKRYHFLLPTVSTVADYVKETASRANAPITLLETEKDRYDAFAASKFAIAASGTVALELAIAKVPHLVSYIVSPLTAYIARKILKIKYVNLSNILLKKFAVPELIQEDCTIANIKKTMFKFLNDKKKRDKQLKDFDRVRDKLGFGNQTPSDKAADIILSKIK
jgi:lipid-A-disaccharide synthase